MSKVAIVRTSPRTLFADYHRLMHLAGYQDVIAKDADTAAILFVLGRRKKTHPQN